MSAQSSAIYVRQATLPSVGQEGLVKLRSSTVAIVGVGGVGSSAAYYLSRSGLGRIRLIDQDIIEPSNLQRIQTATKDDLFRPKAEVLAHRLSEFDPSTKIESIVDTITQANVDQMLDGTDLILDGLDNFRTRYILNKHAVQNMIPYLFASAVGEQAHLALFRPPNTACLECVMPHVTDHFNESCESLGVTPTITGTTGAIGAQTAIQQLLGKLSQLSTQMITLDLDGPEVLFTPLSKRVDCKTCGNTSGASAYSTPAVTLLCGEHTANVLPQEKMEIALDNVTSKIPSEAILSSSKTVLVYRHGPYTISLFRNGRLLISGVNEERRASEIARETWKTLRGIMPQAVNTSDPNRPSGQTR